MRRAAPFALVVLVSAVMMRWAAPELTVHGVSPGMSRAQVERRLGAVSQETPGNPGWRVYPLAGSEASVCVRFSHAGAADRVEGPELEVQGRPVSSRAELWSRLGRPDEIQGPPAGQAREFEIWVYPKRRLLVVSRKGQPWRFILGCAAPSEKR